LTDRRCDIGEDTDTPVAEDYADLIPFCFKGALKKLTLELT